MASGTEALQREKVKPLRSSPTLPVTGAAIGPSDDVRNLIEGNTLRPDYVGEGSPRDAGELLQRLSETPVGMILTAYLSGGAGPSGGASQAVAGVPGRLIPKLRAESERRLSDVFSKGLERREYIDMPPEDMNRAINPVRRPMTEMGKRKLMSGGSLTEDTDYAPNIRIPGYQQKILQMIQERWPRLFAHHKEITDIPYEEKGLAAAGSGHYHGSKKFSVLQFNPETTMHDDPREFADSLAHEMLHSADRLTMGGQRMENAYAHMGELYGNARNPFEKRAEAMGKRMQDIYEATLAAGGTRASRGKNVRVGMRPSHRPSEYYLNLNRKP